MKKTVIWLTLAILCLALCVPGACAETRQGTIWLEGMEETIEETLFENPQGYSFWYAGDLLKAEFTAAEEPEGVIVSNRNSDDCMMLTVITREEAESLAADLAELEAAGRVQAELSCELQDGSWHFVTLIAENGHYLRADGVYAMEAAEGIAKYFQLVLNSVVFADGSQPRAE